MANKSNSQIDSPSKENVIWIFLFPQLIILSISIFWILFSPNDNVIKFLSFSNPVLFLYGLGIALMLAFSGYGFYLFAKKFKDKNKSLDNLVFYFENALSPFVSKLSLVEIILVSSISGFCEEVFFRGILAAKFGIVISSLVFGLLHIPTGKDGKVWIYAVWATICAIFLAWIFLYYQNLWITVIAHIINNIIGMILLKKIKS